MITLQGLQLAHQAVIFGVGDLGIIEYVVAVIVMANLVTECLDAALYIVLVAH